LSDANQISEMEGNRTETRPVIVKDDAVKADVSIIWMKRRAPTCARQPFRKALAEIRINPYQPSAFER